MADEPEMSEFRQELVKLAEITSGCQKIYEDALEALRKGKILPLCAQPLLQQHLEPVNNMSIIKMVETRLKQMKKREVAVLVMGEFNAGKSTFMNILMGGKFLPMHRKKVTHVVCEIRHCSLRMAILKFEDKGDDESVMLPENSTDPVWDELRKCIRTKEYSSKDEAERNTERKVERIIIYWPLKLLEEMLLDTNTRKIDDKIRQEPDGRSRTSSDFPQEFLNHLRRPHARSFQKSEQAETRDPDQTYLKEVATSGDETSSNNEFANSRDTETRSPLVPKSEPIAIEVRTQETMDLNVPIGASIERTSESAPASYKSNQEHNVVGTCDKDRERSKERKYASDAEKEHNGVTHRQRSSENGHISDAEDDADQATVKQVLQQESAGQTIYERREEAAGNGNVSSTEDQVTSERPHARSFQKSEQAETRDPDQTYLKEVATSGDETSSNNETANSRDTETRSPLVPKSEPIAIEVRTQENMDLNVSIGASIERTSESAPASYKNSQEHNVVGTCDKDRERSKEHEYASDAEEEHNGVTHRQRSSENGHISDAEDDADQATVKQVLQQESAGQTIYERREEAAGNGNVSSTEDQVTSEPPAFQFVFLDCPGIDINDEKDSPEYAGMVDEVERCQSFIFILDTNRDTGVNRRGVKALMEDLEKDFKRRNMSLNPDLSLFVANKADTVIGDREASEELLEEILKELTETWPLTRKEHVLLFQADKILRDHVDDTQRKQQIQDFLLQTMRITLEENCIWLLRMLEIAHTMAKLGQESSPVVHRLDSMLQTTQEEAVDLQRDVMELSDVDARRKTWNELRDLLLRNEMGFQTIQWDVNEINGRIPNEEIDWAELSGLLHILIGEKVEQTVRSGITELRQKHKKKLDEIYENAEERMRKLQAGISGLEEMKRDEAHLRSGIFALLAPAVISVSIRALPVINPMVYMAAPIIPLGLFGKFVVEDIQGARNESKRKEFKAHKIEFMKTETNRILNISKTESKGKGELPESPLFKYVFGESRKKVIYDQTEKVINVVKLLQEMTCNKSEPSQKCSKHFIIDMLKFYVQSVLKHKFTGKDDIIWVRNEEGIRCTIDQGTNACTYKAMLSDRFGFDKPVAVKEFRCKLSPSDSSTGLPADVDAYRECFYLRQLSTKRHDTNKLVNFLGTGTSITDGYLNLRIVMERYDGDLKRHVISVRRSPFPEKHRKEFLHYAKECTEGLKFIHENNVIHRDVKPSNYLIKEVVGSDGQSAGLCSVVISDVGCAKSEEVNCTHGNERGTPAYWAPEISLANTFHSKASDVFSLGLVLWEIWVRQLSYDDNGRKRDLLKVTETEKIPVIKKCLKTEPRSRISSADLLAELRTIQS